MTVIAERPAATETTEDLLASLRGRTQPVVLIELRRTQAERAECSAAWERLDSGNPRSVLEQPRLAQRLLDLAADEERLTKEYADAGRRAEAFLELAAATERARQNVEILATALRDHTPGDPKIRQRQLQALDDADRLYARLVWTGQRVSIHPLFREPPDALKTLRLALELRLREIEKVRVPGGKGRFAMPANLAAIIDVLDGRAPKEQCHVALS